MLRLGLGDVYHGISTLLYNLRNHDTFNPFINKRRFGILSPPTKYQFARCFLLTLSGLLTQIN